MPCLRFLGSKRMSCAVVMDISRRMKVCAKLRALAVLSFDVVS